MKNITFQNRISIQAPASDIYGYLLDPGNLPRLHPLIIGVKPLRSEGSASTRVEIQDKIMLFGRIPFYKKYEASFTSIEENRQLLLETFTSPGIHIRNTIILSEETNETRVEERVHIAVPALFASFVLKQIQFSHVEMLKSLKRILESA
ncbi:SRPBCC family protein [Paenibacillus sp. LHD-117]|uniref:SRPBCC family protein n=1 Tax=Paenibacillus sp. LHD-117 TaxID=3071412 RepID=UPI0027E0C4AE|nr:SRPBCC family protein [Paenibacillus sp. LHD-117]MDQ6420402.1 SRPBCC family protein [Paenibacillus sp. LHD-117]